MTAVDLLTRAAVKAREAAKAASHHGIQWAWGDVESTSLQEARVLGGTYSVVFGDTGIVAATVGLGAMRNARAQHSAIWDPATALLVADHLDRLAAWLADERPEHPDIPHDWEASTGTDADMVKGRSCCRPLDPPRGGVVTPPDLRGLCLYAACLALVAWLIVVLVAREVVR